MNVKQAVFRGAVASLLLSCFPGLPASGSPFSPKRAVPVLMLSDLHFDPFRDPAKVPRLIKANVREWDNILGAATSSTQAADYASLQTTCKARGVDTSWGVLEASLRAAHTQQPSPLFVTVSGDLLTHNFDCRLRTLAPAITPEEVSEFAEKTVAFVSRELRRRFPGTPVYVTLGNNDSGCANYRQSAGSDFLRGAVQSFAAGIGNNHGKAALLNESFDDDGDYSVDLPLPIHHGKLIALENVFESADYQDCGGKKNAQGAEAQIAWLRTQLDIARDRHQRVWVMAHIPPGVDTYASFHKYIANPEKLCSVRTPVRMLASGTLNNLLAEYADVVKLALFAHTHMDEVKLIRDSEGRVVPAKLVPSISPVNGNTPAFTVAEVQPETATMLDYTVFTATDASAETWNEEYRFSKTYGLPDFSAPSVQQMSEALAGDKTGKEDLSRTYQHWFLPGDNGDYAVGLRRIWPSYACAIVEDGGQAFHSCMCPDEAAPARAAGQD